MPSIGSRIWLSAALLLLALASWLITQSISRKFTPNARTGQALTFVDQPRAGGDASAFLSVSADSLSIGTVWAAETHAHAISVKNATNAPCSIERVVASCSCTEVTPSRFTLGPGDEQTVQLQIDLRRAATGATTFGRQELDVRVKFVRSDGQTQNVALNGTVCVPLVLPGGGTLRLESPLAFGQPATPQEFSIRKDPRIQEITVVAEGGSETPLTERRELRTPTSATFSIRPDALRPMGPFEMPLSISARADDGRQFGPFPILLAGMVESDVQASRMSVLLVAAHGNGDQAETVCISSRSGKHIEQLEIIESPVEACVEIDQPAQPMAKRLIRLRPCTKLPPGTTIRETLTLRVRSAAEVETAVMPVAVAVHVPRHLLSGGGNVDGR